MRRRLISWLASIAVALPLMSVAVAVTPAQAGPALLPLTVTNNSGRAEQVHLYVLGVYNGRLGYVNTGGAFTPWGGGGNPPVPAPDVSIPGPAQGASRTVNVPINLAAGSTCPSATS